jgi:hypothetical protein
VSAPDRTGYAARQAQLLGALLRGGDYPAGFAAAQADTAGLSLRRKRARAVARAWPALALELRDALRPRFDAFAREQAGAAVAGDPLRDGLAFARWLGGTAPLGDDARVEVLLARATLRRRGLFVGLARLRRPYARLLVVARLPGGGVVCRSLACRATPSPRASCRRARAGAARARAGARPCARASPAPRTGP